MLVSQRGLNCSRPRGPSLHTPLLVKSRIFCSFSVWDYFLVIESSGFFTASGCSSFLRYVISPSSWRLLILRTWCLRRCLCAQQCGAVSTAAASWGSSPRARGLQLQLRLVQGFWLLESARLPVRCQVSLWRGADGPTGTLTDGAGSLDGDSRHRDPRLSVPWSVLSFRLGVGSCVVTPTISQHHVRYSGSSAVTWKLNSEVACFYKPAETLRF